MRALLLLMVGLWLSPLPAASEAAGQGGGRPPNVLFIVADDLNNDLGAYGHPTVLSPSIDRLAERGVRFNRAYNQYPQCNQSRASMMTGMRPDSVKVYDLRTHFRQTVPNVVTLPQHFRNNGYFTARVGKIYHYDVPQEIGTSGLDDPISWDQVVNPIGRDKENEETIVRQLGRQDYREDPGPDEDQTDGKVATEAIRLLEENRNRPFFLAVGFFRPHFPYVAPRRYFDLYPFDQVEAPGDPMADLADVPAAAVAFTQPPNWGMTDEQMRRAIRAYYASISFMDAQVGRVLGALDRLGLRENTMVIFVSDHGYNLGNKGQWMKQSLYEPSALTPLIISAPGQRVGEATSRTVELLDLYPTLTDLAGLSTPAHVQGRSLRPLLRNPREKWPHAAYTQVRRVGRGGEGGGGDAGGGRSGAIRPAGGSGAGQGPRGAPAYMGYTVRTERWRYTEWDGGRKGAELYDHRNDPGEVLNLASAPNYAKTREEMRRLLAAVSGH